MGTKGEHRKSRSILNDMRDAVKETFDVDLYRRIERRDLTRTFMERMKEQIEIEQGTSAKKVYEYSEKLQMGFNETISYMASQDAIEISKYLDHYAPLEEEQP